jgi:hypothetical protein
MNVGQVFEANLAMSLNDMKNQLKKMVAEKINQKEIQKYILNYIKIIDNTKDNWYYKQFEEQLSQIDDNFINNLFFAKK